MSSLTSPKVVAQRRKEAAFQRAVVDFAARQGWRSWHCYNPRWGKEKGFPDLMLFRERLLFMELKAYQDNGRAGRVDPEQERFHDDLRAAGQEVYVFWDDSDAWAEIVKVLSDGRLSVAKDSVK